LAEIKVFGKLMFIDEDNILEKKLILAKRHSIGNPKKALEFYLKLNVALEEQRERYQRIKKV
jgi:hypothetical protein